jgi:uncharacterized membrane protein
MRLGMFDGIADVLSAWGELDEEMSTLPKIGMEGESMKFAANLLRVNAVLFIVFGICFVVAPEFFAYELTRSVPWTSSALIDMRATYGGMGLGIGLLFWFLASQRETVIAGLVSSFLLLGATAMARMVGFVADGSPNIFMQVRFGAEVLFVVLSAAALKRFTD